MEKENVWELTSRYDNFITWANRRQTTGMNLQHQENQQVVGLMLRIFLKNTWFHQTTGFINNVLKNLTHPAQFIKAWTAATWPSRKANKTIITKIRNVPSAFWTSQAQNPATKREDELWKKHKSMTILRKITHQFLPQNISKWAGEQQQSSPSNFQRGLSVVQHSRQANKNAHKQKKNAQTPDTNTQAQSLNTQNAAVPFLRLSLSPRHYKK